MIRTAALAGALALSLAAPVVQAQPMGGAHMGQAAGAALPTPDYIVTAAQSDEFEIAEAHVALNHSHNPQVDQFARRMILDHTKSTHMIQAAIRRSGHAAPPPPPLTDAQNQMMAQLSAAGPNFDRVYVQQQLQSHEMALSTHEGYANGGENPALRHTAAMIVPVVQSHLRMLHEMQSRMG